MMGFVDFGAGLRIDSSCVLLSLCVVEPVLHLGCLSYRPFVKCCDVVCQHQPRPFLTEFWDKISFIFGDLGSHTLVLMSGSYALVNAAGTGNTREVDRILDEGIAIDLYDSRVNIVIKLPPWKGIELSVGMCCRAGPH